MGISVCNSSQKINLKEMIKKKAKEQAEFETLVEEEKNK